MININVKYLFFYTHNFNDSWNGRCKNWFFSYKSEINIAILTYMKFYYNYKLIMSTRDNDRKLCLLSRSSDLFFFPVRLKYIWFNKQKKFCSSFDENGAIPMHFAQIAMKFSALTVCIFVSKCLAILLFLSYRIKEIFSRKFERERERLEILIHFAVQFCEFYATHLYHSPSLYFNKIRIDKND